ncbi:MAG: hypothetical protein DRJ50_05335 [Actinobacteria bacterium]|nr:MAG: hypothetical protein DRJ50_05335 [Actinomycetota bacterium]
MSISATAGLLDGTAGSLGGIVEVVDGAREPAVGVDWTSGVELHAANVMTIAALIEATCGRRIGRS